MVCWSSRLVYCDNIPSRSESKRSHGIKSLINEIGDVKSFARAEINNTTVEITVLINSILFCVKKP
jgi:hypothetical protein